MVSAKLDIQIRRQIKEAANASSTVGQFHQKLVEIFTHHRVVFRITENGIDGDIVNQFGLTPGGTSSVLRYEARRKVQIHISQTELNELSDEPESNTPRGRRRLAVYKLLSSAMRAARGDNVDVSIDL